MPSRPGAYHRGMRRADRLFQIVLLLGRGRVTTARELAERLEVSERTVYRDVADLVASGVPVEGAPGLGYALRRGYRLPPLMFDEAELQALLFGMDVVERHGDPELAEAAQRIVAKVDAVLPERLRPRLEERHLFVPPGTGLAVGPVLRELRHAVADRVRVFLDYRDAQGATTERIVWPLVVIYWGGLWMLGAWCELRQAFRNFRLDRIAEVRVLGSRFDAEDPERGIAAFVRSVSG